MRALMLLLALGALVVAGCGGGSEEDAAVPPPTVTETAPEDTAKRPTAPAVEGTTLGGERASLASLRGKHVFVNVWSSW